MAAKNNMFKKIQSSRVFKFLLSILLFQGACVLSGDLTSSALASSDKHVTGWVENVQIFPESLNIYAKIDTGADHSSLNVEKISEFIRQGEQWVKFSFTPQYGSQVTLKRKVFRYARVKRKAAKSQERPVILLNLCLGKVFKRDIEVNLADRGNFKYNMLIGRSFLKDSFVVDSSLTVTLEPSCPQVDTN